MIAFIRSAWNVDPSIPTFIPGADPAAIHDLADLYRLAATGFPAMRLSEVSSAFDLDQSDRWAFVGGGDAREFTVELRDKLGDVESTVPIFSSYVFAGSTHTITNRQETYTVTSAGTPFRDWLAALMGGEMPRSVDCAPDCGGPFTGDLGAPEEWACLAGASARAPDAAVFDLTLRLVGGPYELSEVDESPRLGDVHIRACARDDADCASPVVEGDTSTSGELVLRLPAAEAGFDGSFLIDGRDVVPTRVYAWPPIVSGGAWFLNGHGIGLESTVTAQTISSRRDVRSDPRAAPGRAAGLQRQLHPRRRRAPRRAAARRLPDRAPSLGRGRTVAASPLRQCRARPPRPLLRRRRDRPRGGGAPDRHRIGDDHERGRNGAILSIADPNSGTFDQLGRMTGPTISKLGQSISNSGSQLSRSTGPTRPPHATPARA